jgi:hypothetical protein
MLALRIDGEILDQILVEDDLAARRAFHPEPLLESHLVGVGGNFRGFDFVDPRHAITD